MPALYVTRPKHRCFLSAMPYERLRNRSVSQSSALLHSSTSPPPPTSPTRQLPENKSPIALRTFCPSLRQRDAALPLPYREHGGESGRLPVPDSRGSTTENHASTKEATAFGVRILAVLAEKRRLRQPDRRHFLGAPTARPKVRPRPSASRRARGTAPRRQRAARNEDGTSGRCAVRARGDATDRSEPRRSGPAERPSPAQRTPSPEPQPRSPPRPDGSAALLPPPAGARPPSPGAARGPGRGGWGRGAAAAAGEGIPAAGGVGARMRPRSTARLRPLAP